MKLKIVVTFIIMSFLIVSCGGNQNSVGDNSLPLNTFNNSTGFNNNGVNNGINNGINNQTIYCGNIYSNSPNGFSIQFQFYTSNGAFNLQAGDQITQSLLNQMPPNVFANNVCGTGRIDGNTIRLVNIYQN